MVSVRRLAKAQAIATDSFEVEVDLACGGHGTEGDEMFVAKVEEQVIFGDEPTPIGLSTELAGGVVEETGRFAQGNKIGGIASDEYGGTIDERDKG